MSRTLDTAVATALGWKWYSRSTPWAKGGTFISNLAGYPCDMEVENDLGNRLGDWGRYLPHYSTDIRAAMGLVEHWINRARSDGEHIDLFFEYSGISICWLVEVNGVFIEGAPTLPEAICLTFLKSKGESL